MTYATGYTAEAEIWCEDHIKVLYGIEATRQGAMDNEGNPIGVIFPDSEFDYQPLCSACHEPIEAKVIPQDEDEPVRLRQDYRGA